MKIETAIPFGLRRAGITSVADNLAPGHEVGGFAKDFVRIFRPDIEVKLLGWGGTKNPNEDGSNGKPR